MPWLKELCIPWFVWIKSYADFPEDKPQIFAFTSIFLFYPRCIIMFINSCKEIDLKTENKLSLKVGASPELSEDA